MACYECGSAGHPTCLDWEEMGIVRRVQAYNWMCQDCKRCEVCDTKEDDVRLFSVLVLSSGSSADRL